MYFEATWLILTIHLIECGSLLPSSFEIFPKESEITCAVHLLIAPLASTDVVEKLLLDNYEQSIWTVVNSYHNLSVQPLNSFYEECTINLYVESVNPNWTDHLAYQTKVHNSLYSSRGWKHSSFIIVRFICSLQMNPALFKPYRLFVHFIECPQILAPQWFPNSRILIGGPFGYRIGPTSQFALITNIDYQYYKRRVMFSFKSSNKLLHYLKFPVCLNIKARDFKSLVEKPRCTFQEFFIHNLMDQFNFTVNTAVTGDTEGNLFNAFGIIEPEGVLEHGLKHFQKASTFLFLTTTDSTELVQCIYASQMQWRTFASTEFPILMILMCVYTMPIFLTLLSLIGKNALSKRRIKFKAWFIPNFGKDLAAFINYNYVSMMDRIFLALCISVNILPLLYINTNGMNLVGTATIYFSGGFKFKELKDPTNKLASKRETEVVSEILETKFKLCSSSLLNLVFPIKEETFQNPEKLFRNRKIPLMFYLTGKAYHKKLLSFKFKKFLAKHYCTKINTDVKTEARFSVFLNTLQHELILISGLLREAGLFNIWEELGFSSAERNQLLGKGYDMSRRELLFAQKINKAIIALLAIHLTACFIHLAVLAASLW